MSESLRILALRSTGLRPNTDSRTVREARSLARAGHDVTMLCWDRDGDLLPEELLDGGIHVVRIRSSAYMRAWRFDLLRLRPMWRALLRKAMRLGPFDAIHAHDLDTLPAAVPIGPRVIYDAHEIWPWLLETTRCFPWSPRAFERLDERLIPRCDAVVVAGDAFRRYGPLRDATVVRNTAPLQEFVPPPNGRRLILGYAGTTDGRYQLLDAARTMGASGDFAFEWNGGTRSHPHALIPAFIQSCDAMLCATDPQFRLHRIAAPNKFFEAIASGRPAIVSAGTWLAELVTQNDCGLAIPFSPAGLRSALEIYDEDRDLLESHAKNAWRLAKDELNWAFDERRLLEVFHG